MVDPAIVLASGSPRRAELLRRIGVDPRIRPADVDESARAGESAGALVARLARTKGRAADHVRGDLVIAADTVVVLDDDVLGKPSDAADAERMLRALSGRDHRVLTGVHVAHDDREASTVVETTVRFRRLSEEEIVAYVATGEPLDKAGAYGIQGAGGMFVDSIEGSDSNVIGLPLAAVVRLAAEVGVTLLPRRNGLTD